MFQFEVSQGIAAKGDFVYKKGNLIDAFVFGDVDHFVHGCNCFNTMGSGMALMVKRRLPELYEKDLETQSGDPTKLGSFSFYDYGGRFAFNAYVQYNYGNKGRYLDYDSLRLCVRGMASFLEESNGVGYPQIIGFPMIGCGLAGGHWEIVSTILKEELSEHCIHIYQL